MTLQFGTAPAPEPGIYYDVPDAEYRTWNLPSQSTLSMFRNRDLCELDVHYRLINPIESTPQMQLGNQLELAVDDPDNIGGNIQPLPKEIKARRGLAWETFREQNPDITYLPKTDWDKHKVQVEQLKAMATQVNLVAGALLKDAKRQVSFVADMVFVGEDGNNATHRVKGRLDYLDESEKLILDLKSTFAGGPRAVGRSMWTFGYDIQSALYTDAMEQLLDTELKFLFVVCRTSAPYPVTVYDGHNTTEMAGQFRDIGRRSYQIYLERLAECVGQNRWRGYYSPTDPDDLILDIELPSWAGTDF